MSTTTTSTSSSTTSTEACSTGTYRLVFDDKKGSVIPAVATWGDEQANILVDYDNTDYASFSLEKQRLVMCKDGKRYELTTPNVAQHPGWPVYVMPSSGSGELNNPLKVVESSKGGDLLFTTYTGQTQPFLCGGWFNINNSGKSDTGSCTYVKVRLVPIADSKPPTRPTTTSARTSTTSTPTATCSPASTPFVMTFQYQDNPDGTGRFAPSSGLALTSDKSYGNLLARPDYGAQQFWFVGTNIQTCVDGNYYTLSTVDGGDQPAYIFPSAGVPGTYPMNVVLTGDKLAFTSANGATKMWACGIGYFTVSDTLSDGHKGDCTAVIPGVNYVAT